MNSNEMTETTVQPLIEKRNRQKGVTTVEYALMLVLVAIAVSAGTTGLANKVISSFAAMAAKLV